MSENPFKRRVREAKVQAMQVYRDDGYHVDPSDNSVICFTATDKARTHECKVRVVVDSIAKRDVDLMLGFPALPSHRKVIMCRQEKRWLRRIYDHANNLCQ